MSSQITGTFVSLTHKHLTTREGNPFTKTCFKIEVINEKTGKSFFPFFEAKESIFNTIERIKKGDSVKVSFLPDSKGVEGNEISINRAFRVEIL
jgi:hypothetical protein